MDAVEGFFERLTASWRELLATRGGATVGVERGHGRHVDPPAAW